MAGKKVERWYDAEMGDYVSFHELFQSGGKFYAPEGEHGPSYCDMPTMTFKLESGSAPGYERIE